MLFPISSRFEIDANLRWVSGKGVSRDLARKNVDVERLGDDTCNGMGRELALAWLKFRSGRYFGAFLVLALYSECIRRCQQAIDDIVARVRTCDRFPDLLVELSRSVRFPSDLLLASIMIEKFPQLSCKVKCLRQFPSVLHE